MKKMLQKIFSILLAACFVLSVVPAPAAAAETALTTNGKYNTDGSWVAEGDGSITHNINGTAVTLSKTAKALGNNQFEITLQVQTSQTTSTVTGGGAVVLVMDVSGSMAYCADCGGENGHDRDCPKSGSRMDAAKTAALNFLKSYAGTDASASRMLAIVTFSTEYGVEMEWTNVAGGAGSNYQKAVDEIKGMSAGGGTNLEGGLYTASNLLGSVAGDKSVVLLTDGAPTYYIGGGYGSSGSPTCNSRAAAQADAIKGKDAKLYTVCFGVADDLTYEGFFSPDGPKVGAFLRDSVASSNCAYNADNSAELYGVFAAITESITDGLDGAGWTATDPMPGMIDVVSGIGTNFTGSDGNYTWTLGEPEKVVDGNTTTYVYKYTYRVELDVQDPEYVEGTFVPTNEPTYLNTEHGQFAFPVPGVKGYWDRTDVTVKKEWKDNDDQDDVRPESVTVQLMEGDRKIGKPVTLTANDGWTYTWNGVENDLIKQSKGAYHVYTVVEVGVDENVYKPNVVPTSGENFNIVVNNIHEVYKTDVTVTKVWDDNNNQDGKRPASISVVLKADGEEIETVELNETNKWTYTWKGLDKNKAGTAINYTVEEVELPEDYTGGKTTGSIAEGFTITNTHAPEKTSVKVTKVWSDANNQDGIRPESVNIVLMNGEDQVASATLNKENNWTTTFDNLDKYAGGEEIAYTVKESVVPNGYSASEPTGSMADGFTITNSHTPATTEVTVTKVWNDNNDQDGKRPDSISVVLKADGAEKATVELNEANDWSYTWENLPEKAAGQVITYTVDEVEVLSDYDKVITGSAANGYLITNTHAPEQTSVKVTKKWDDNNNQDGIRPESVNIVLMNGEDQVASATLNKENNWTTTFDNLDKYAGGEEIAYTVKESVVPNGYSASKPTGSMADGFTITNTHTPETTKVTVVKKWDDDSNLEGFRPKDITIQLNAKGEPVGEPVTFSGKGDTWTYEFENLPKYEAGEEIVYSVTEDAVSKYNTNISEIENGIINITNSRKVERIDISVTKEWEDDSDRDGLRPDDIKLTLLANDVAVQKDVSVTGEGNTWTYTFSELPKYANGEEIVYSVTEDAVAEYETEISKIKDGKITITNTHDPKLIDVSVTKVWDDADNQDGKRPSNVEVVLYSNGEPTKYSHKLSGKYETDFYTFKDLYAFEGGEPVVYTVVEKEVPAGYESNTTGSMTDGFTITNTHVPEMIDEIKVTKVWIDAEDQDGKRPTSITIILLADKEKVDEIVLSDENGWSGSFNELPMYKDGKKIEYEVEEVEVEDYESKVTGSVEEGFTVTNTHEVEKIDEINVTKVWDDADDQDGIRPEKITVNLLANGKIVDSKELKATLRTIFTGDWTATFKDMPKYENGEEIVYTITENAVSGYETKITGSVENGFTVTNTHEPEMTKLDVQKFWDDENDKHETRAEKVKITLYANGKSTGKTVTLNEKNQWFDSFENLPKYDNGKEIKYTVKEASLALYKASYSYNGTKAVVTNTLSEVPNTGDTSNVGLYLGLMGVCAVAAVALILLNKKKRNA